MIRPANANDAAAIANIYNHYVENTTITFEETAVSLDEMQRRIQEVTTTLPWLVVEGTKGVVGYAYASKWKSRHAYRHSVESTVYLDASESGRGLGTRLYMKLLAELKTRAVHCVMGGIALPNIPSVTLHERLGFAKVAHFKEVGWKQNRWLDVGYWQLIF